MKAWLLESFNGLEKMKLADTPDPQPAAGEVVIRVLYAGLNPADRYLAEDQYPAKPPLPHILGRDGLGIIESIGPQVSEFRVGEKVAIVRSEIGVTRAGTFAERVAVPVESLIHPPAGWTDEQAAGATLVYLTAYQAITQWSDLPRQCVTLITGASGGVGVASIQLCKALGHTVIGLSRNPEKCARLLEIGADATLDPFDSQWRQILKDSLGSRRVDLAIDNIGGPLFNEVVNSLGQNGRVSCVGRLAGPVPQFNTASLFFRRLKIGGVAVGTYTAAESGHVWQEIVELLGQRSAKPIVDSVLPFDQLPGAFHRLKEGPMGKVLLRVAP